MLILVLPFARACVADGRGCLQCLRNQCLHCANGYFLSGGVCLACYPGCLSCINGLYDYCLTCNPGYLMVSGQCSPCYLTEAGCWVCSQMASGCLQCLAGFVLAGSTCNPCFSGCQKCMSVTTCLACTAGYILSPMTPGSCDSCSPVCSTCFTSSTTCGSCATGFFLDSRILTCSACSNNCGSCLSSSGCAICKNAMYYNTADDSCTPCSTGCFVCLTATSDCAVCSSGYLFQSYACPACSSLIANCATCISASVCVACSSTYYLTAGTCSTCGAGCQLCFNPSSCLYCSLRYFNSGNCAPCTANCQYCTGPACVRCNTGFVPTGNTCNANPASSSCDSGKGLIGGMAGSCVPCSTGCAFCSNSNNCLYCQQAYHLQVSGGTGTCTACSSNCLVCDTSGCQYCQSAYQLSMSSTCVIDSVANCVSSISGYCLLCKVGYFTQAGPSSQTCMACNFNCAYCADQPEGNCLKCLPGFFFVVGTSRNRKLGTCSVCGTGCAYCNNYTDCTICKNQYYSQVTATTVNCVACGQGCFICDYSSCFSCLTGYFFNLYFCQRCHPSCYDCVDADSCVGCALGFVLSSGLCQKCSSGVLFCLGSSHQICSMAYYLDSGSCLPCVSPCFSCTGETNCLSCEYKFYIDTSYACIPCSQNCLLCNQNGCHICDYAFLLVKASCVQIQYYYQPSLSAIQPNLTDSVLVTVDKAAKFGTISITVAVGLLTLATLIWDIRNKLRRSQPGQIKQKAQGQEVEKCYTCGKDIASGQKYLQPNCVHRFHEGCLLPKVVDLKRCPQCLTR